MHTALVGPVRRGPDPTHRDLVDPANPSNRGTVTELRTTLGRARVPARLGYAAVLLAATLTDLRLGPGSGSVAQRVSRAISQEVSPRDIVDAARNVLLFAGWGLTWMATAPAGRTVRSIAFAVGSGTLISVSVEAAQLLSSSRYASILDVATNAFGSLVGAIALVGLVMAASNLRHRRSASFRAVFVALPYGLAVLGEVAVPLFRHEPVAGAWGWPWRRAAVVLSEVDWSSLGSVPLGSVLLVAPAAILAAWWLSGSRSSTLTTPALALLGCSVIPVVELLHAPLGLAVIPGAALVQAIAWGLGAALGHVLVRQGWLADRNSRQIMGAYLVLLGLWTLRPYQPGVGDLALFQDRGWWIPLELLRQRGDIFSVVDVANTFLLLIPVGAWLAIHPLRTRGPLAHLLPAIYLAIVLEALQLGVAGRTPDTTDVLVQIAGAMVGWVIVRRAGFSPRPYRASQRV